MLQDNGTPGSRPLCMWLHPLPSTRKLTRCFPRGPEEEDMDVCATNIQGHTSQSLFESRALWPQEEAPRWGLCLTHRHDGLGYPLGYRLPSWLPPGSAFHVPPESHIQQIRSEVEPVPGSRLREVVSLGLLRAMR